jgi:hypothetical protein
MAIGKQSALPVLMLLFVALEIPTSIPERPECASRLLPDIAQRIVTVPDQELQIRL